MVGHRTSESKCRQVFSNLHYHSIIEGRFSDGITEAPNSLKESPMHEFALPHAVFSKPTCTTPDET